MTYVSDNYTSYSAPSRLRIKIIFEYNTVYREIYTSFYFCKSAKLKILRNKFFANPEFEATPMHNIDNSIAHARAHGAYFYDIKFIRLKENSYNSQKFCTLKITRCTVMLAVLHACH